MVILGKSGSGKSTVGNTILGRSAFEVVHGGDHVTRRCQRATAVIDGINVTVTDTPGIPETESERKLMEKVLKHCYKLAEPRPLVLVLVMRLDERFSCDIDSIEWIKNVFGEKALQFSIILFSHFDQLQDRPVHAFIQQSEHFKAVLSMCGGRYHVFNNLANNPTEISEVLMKISKLVAINNGTLISQKMYRAAETAGAESQTGAATTVQAVLEIIAGAAPVTVAAALAGFGAAVTVRVIGEPEGISEATLAAAAAGAAAVGTAVGAAAAMRVRAAKPTAIGAAAAGMVAVSGAAATVAGTTGAGAKGAAAAAVVAGLHVRSEIGLQVASTAEQLIRGINIIRNGAGAAASAAVAVGRAEAHVRDVSTAIAYAAVLAGLVAPRAAATVAETAASATVPGASEAGAVAAALAVGVLASSGFVTPGRCVIVGCATLALHQIIGKRRRSID